MKRFVPILLLLLLALPRPLPLHAQIQPIPTEDMKRILETERRVLKRVNELREEEGLNTLKMDTRLRVIARAHSQDMVRRDFFGHRNPDGQSPFDRLDAAGVDFRAAGENLGWNNFDKPVEEAIEGWLESPTHRETMFNPVYTHTGVGVALKGEDAFYFTQEFLKPPE